MNISALEEADRRDPSIPRMCIPGAVTLQLRTNTICAGQSESSAENDDIRTARHVESVVRERANCARDSQEDYPEPINGCPTSSVADSGVVGETESSLGCRRHHNP